MAASGSPIANYMTLELLKTGALQLKYVMCVSSLPTFEDNFMYFNSHLFIVLLEFYSNCKFVGFTGLMSAQQGLLLQNQSMTGSGMPSPSLQTPTP